MNRIRNLFLWLPAVLWSRIIWNLSAQSASVSGDLSDRLLWRLLALLSPAFAAGNMAAQNAAVELLSFFERKAAHMFLYFVLILLLWLALVPLLRAMGRQILGAGALCALLAALDEYHQTFIPGRSGQARDVLIDLIGAALAVALVCLIRWSVRRWKTGPKGLTAVLPVLAGTLLLFITAFLPISFSRLPFFSWAAQRFVPVFSSLSAVGQDTLLNQLAPMLREVCFLAVCGLMGCCASISAALAGPPIRAALLRAILWSVVPACVLAVFLAPSMVPAAGLLALLGCLLLTVPQLAVSYLKRPACR